MTRCRRAACAASRTRPSKSCSRSPARTRSASTPSDFKGAGQVRHEDSKPYEFGDPVANLNLHETLKNAMSMRREPRADERPAGGPGLRYPARKISSSTKPNIQTSCATVLLLDMSGSMARYGKYYHAKKVALALLGLIRGRYPEDTLKIIGFYTYASPLTERALLQAGPKPVSIFDSRVFLRMPWTIRRSSCRSISRTSRRGSSSPGNILRKQPAPTSRSSASPTANRRPIWKAAIWCSCIRPASAPPGPRWKRSQACAAAGIQISTFALIEDYFYLGLKNFVDQMARVGRGVAIYCNAGELGGFVLDSFVRGRRSRSRKSLGVKYSASDMSTNTIHIARRLCTREKRRTQESAALSCHPAQ